MKFVRFCHCLFNTSFLPLYLSFCICTHLPTYILPAKIGLQNSRSRKQRSSKKNNSRKANTSICAVQYQQIAAKAESTACWITTGFKNKKGFFWVSFYFIITNNIRWQIDIAQQTVNYLQRLKNIHYVILWSCCFQFVLFCYFKFENSIF